MKKGLAITSCIVITCIGFSLVSFAEEPYIPNNEISLSSSVVPDSLDVLGDSEGVNYSGDEQNKAIYKPSSGAEDSEKGTKQSKSKPGEKVVSKPSSSKSKTETNPGGALFDTSGLDLTQTEETREISNKGNAIVSKFMVLAMTLYPILVIMQMILDVFCLTFKPIGYLVKNKVKFQLLSDEADRQLSLQLGTSGGAGAPPGGMDMGGIAPPPPTPAGGSEGAKFSIMSYLTSRMWTIIICAIILMLAGTGLLFAIVNACCNLVYGLIRGAIG